MFNVANPAAKKNFCDLKHIRMSFCTFKFRKEEIKYPSLSIPITE